MFRPMIYAPMPSPKRLAKSLSGPVVPPVLPFISRNARVPMYQPCSSSPPTPSGSFSPWRGPAPYPSSEIAKLWTRSLDMESFSGFHMRRMGRPEIDRRTIGLLLDPSLLLLVQQHPRRPKPVAQHRDPAAEVAFVEPKGGRARPGVIDVDVELHLAAMAKAVSFRGASTNSSTAPRPVTATPASSSPRLVGS